jgi:hypothetical protein
VHENTQLANLEKGEDNIRSRLSVQQSRNDARLHQNEEVAYNAGIYAADASFSVACAFRNRQVSFQSGLK